MTSRDQTLALLLIGIMTLTVGAVGGYLLVLVPVQKNRAAELALRNEIDDLEKEERAQFANAKKLAIARARSLPADADLARGEYQVALGRLLDAAGAPKGYTINQRVVDNSVRYVPELSKNKPIYTRIAYEVTVKKADMWIVKDFLKGYYELGVLHQITHFSIKKDEDSAKGPAKRNDLTVTFTTEAVIVDGAENRRTLLPVPTAFAAIGGGMLHQSMAHSKEYGRGVTPPVLVPILSTKPRDYSLIVLKDPFNGPLPQPPSFKLHQPKDVKVVQDEKPTTVKIAVSGEGSVGAKVVVQIEGAPGGPFAPGALKVDPKTLAIEIPKTSASEGSATVSVIATSVEGKTEKTSFTVFVGPKPPPPEIVEKPPPVKPDVDTAIILTMVTFRSDGTASAAIRDAANRQRYEIEVTGKKVTVSKFYYIKDKKKEESDPDPNGVLAISDDNSATRRTFKVVGVDGDGLILQDQKPAAAKPAAPPKGFGWPPKGGGPPKQGPAAPLAAIAGNMTNGVTLAPGKVYRWTVGQSLATIKELTDSEATKVLKQSADTGPMFEVAGK